MQFVVTDDVKPSSGGGQAACSREMPVAGRGGLIEGQVADELELHDVTIATSGAQIHGDYPEAFQRGPKMDPNSDQVRLVSIV